MVVVVFFAIVAVLFAVTSIHWPLMCDSPVMHYVTFLINHGLKPYSEISDNNLPGSYLTESWAMHVFGGGDLGWRVYEFFLLGALAAALAVIARPYDWVAGIYAAGVFLVMHAAEGPNYSVEREQVLTLLLMGGYAFLFEALRGRSPLLMLPFGVCVALAGSIKPTMIPLGLALFLVAGYVLRKRQWSLAPYLGYAVAGVAAMAALDLGFLLRYHALGNFLFIMRRITPAYIAMNNPSWPYLVHGMFPATLSLLVPFGIVAIVLNRHWNWERWALAMGAAFGLFSYFAQRKGFNHHRYTFVTCVLLLFGLEFLIGLRRPGWPRRVAVSAIALTLVLLAPRYLWIMHKQPSNSEFTLSLEDDLRGLGGEQLQGQVQCFDLVYGCLNSLYHLHLMENTGFTGDLLFFSPEPGFAREFYRKEFWELARKDPATVMVVSNEWFGMPNSFNKLDTWPEFKSYLNANYTPVLDRVFLHELGVTRMQGGGEPDAYRIYVRNGSPLIARAATLRGQERAER